MKTRFKIKGLDCANCAAELERAINKLDEINNASISFMTEKLEIEYDAEKEEIIKKVKNNKKGRTRCNNRGNLGGNYNEEKRD